MKSFDHLRQVAPTVQEWMSHIDTHVNISSCIR